MLRTFSCASGIIWLPRHKANLQTAQLMALREAGSRSPCPPFARTLPSSSAPRPWSLLELCSHCCSPAGSGQARSWPSPCSPAGSSPAWQPAPGWSCSVLLSCLGFCLTCSFQATCCTGCSLAEHLDVTSPLQSQHLLNLSNAFQLQSAIIGLINHVSTESEKGKLNPDL